MLRWQYAERTFRSALERTMEKGRLGAFSDGVVAVIITIMVLEMKVPHAVDMAALWPLLPVFLSYVLSSLLVWEDVCQGA
jgi:uncharacterized membrane protein